MTEPNKERLAAWTDALRSGEFRQAKGRLFDGDSYCCLGVACMVAVANGLDLDLEDEFGAHKNLNLPEVVGEWLGLDESLTDPIVGKTFDDSEFVYATEANDEFEWTFERIADAIDDHYKVRVTEGA